MGLGAAVAFGGSTIGGTDAKSWVNGSTAIFSDGSPTITADLASVSIDGITVTGSNGNIAIAMEVKD